MAIFIKNASASVSMSLNILRLVGYWPPKLTGMSKVYYNCYTVFSFMFLNVCNKMNVDQSTIIKKADSFVLFFVNSMIDSDRRMENEYYFVSNGTYLIVQLVDLFLIWGDIPKMTAASFLMFTNLAQAVKIITILCRRERLQAIIENADRVLSNVSSKEAKEIVRICDREVSMQQWVYCVLAVLTTTGWVASAEKNELPLRAWYPYDTSKSPAYEYTYIHQAGALFVCAALNVAKDNLMSSMVGQCRCRFQLLGLALSSGLPVPGNNLLTPEQEERASARLRICVLEHQAVLEAARELQACFSVPFFAQLTVSLNIICVTAFQLVSMEGNWLRFLSMGAYLFCMLSQLFIFCYQGNQLSEESSEIANAAYFSPWYQYSVPLRRSLLIVMVRSRLTAKITPGGFTTLSLATYMSIIKASYSLFTLLKQVEEKN